MPLLTLTLALLPAAYAGDPAAGRDDSAVPGTVIHHSPAASRVYVGSPGIAVLPDGAYLAKCDDFGKGTTEFESARSRVFRSDDRGESWEPVAVLDGLFWASLFVHRGDAYLLGTTKHHGLLNVRRSTDGGRTWTEPTDGSHGLLTPTGEYHTAPGPVLTHAGRLWRAAEDASLGTTWGYRYGAMMMSAPVDADLLDRNSWTFSNVIPRDGSWLNGDFKAWLEGNAVAVFDQNRPSGQVVNMLRVQTETGRGRVAAICTASDDGRTLSFDADAGPSDGGAGAAGFVPFDGGSKKFTVRRDPKTDLYWTLASVVPPAVTPGRGDGRTVAGGVRNTLALRSSPDLRHWTTRCVLLHHPDVEHHAFQYPDWVFDGDDLLAAVRTGYDDGLGGAHRAHDANYLTFHRIEHFRDLTMADSAVDPATLGYDVGQVSNLPRRDER